MIPKVSAIKTQINSLVSRNGRRLKFSRNDFFVSINGYGKNKEWADKTIETADLAVSLFKRQTGFENILKLIVKGIKEANQITFDLAKRKNTGVLRAKRNGWANNPSEAYTLYSVGRYSKYKDRLNDVCSNPLSNTPSDVGISRPIDYREIRHGDRKLINSSLDRVINAGKTIFPKYILNKPKTEDLDEINSTIAEIRWVLAHSTPWIRGSDAISNVLMRAMYKAINIKTYPLAKGVSLDLEAYCTELEDYKKRFATYFEKPPKIVN